MRIADARGGGRWRGNDLWLGHDRHAWLRSTRAAHLPYGRM